MNNTLDELKLLIEHIEKSYLDYRPFTRKDCNGLMVAFRYADGSFHYQIVTDKNKDPDVPLEDDEDFIKSLMMDLIYIMKNKQWKTVRENFNKQFELITDKDIDINV